MPDAPEQIPFSSVEYLHNKVNSALTITIYCYWHIPALPKSKAEWSGPPKKQLGESWARP